MNLYLLPGKVIWYKIDDDKTRIVFRIWNYELAPNYSISFAVHLDPDNFFLEVHFVFSKALKLASNLFVGR